jgi:hypothetical protein
LDVEFEDVIEEAVEREVFARRRRDRGRPRLDDWF